MHVRSSHFELTSLGDDVVARDDFDLFFKHAAGRKHAWITGSCFNIPTLQARTLAAGHGYSLWAPEITANDVSKYTSNFVAVREDLVSDGVEKSVQLTNFGMDQLDDAPHEAPSGLVTVSFGATRAGLGKVHVGSASYFSPELSEHFDYWRELSLEDDGLVFFGPPGYSVVTDYPMASSNSGRVLEHSQTTQFVSFVNDVLYVETTTNVKPQKKDE